MSGVEIIKARNTLSPRARTNFAKRLRVAAYCRVSTDSEDQLNSYKSQVAYYTELIKGNSDWTLAGIYADEAITGTQVTKREDFQRLINDCMNGDIDMIVTKSISRFARNTVDTLQQTRILKKYGVEVYFTEDNIWTMNDEDGELRLTIMATLAQNESKKTSIRVKAGQKVSFQNAVPYGTGNILGYDRVGKEFVINEEQAKTVRMIFDMYLDGMGLRQIQFALEGAGRLTATGLKNWSCSTISRVLNNAFYCGTIVYRKEYVPDYLEQKKIKNHGEIENIVAEGTHIPIVTKEEYARVKKKMDAKTQSVDNRGKRGKHASGDVWTKKLKCSCSGGSFNRRVWHRVASGEPQYAYQCYKQITTGTIATRTKKGLSLEGICEAPMVPRWKLEVMAKVVFQNFWKDRTAVRLIAEEMLERHIQDDRYINFEKEIKELKTKIAKTDKKYENLVDLRVNGEIDKAMFDLKKKELLEEKERLERQLEGYQVDEDMSDEDYNRRLEVLKCGLENNFDFSVYDIPEEIIDDFVDEIIVYKDCFLWKLSMFGDETRMKLCVNKDKSVEIEKTPNVDTRGTGGNFQMMP